MSAVLTRKLAAMKAARKDAPAPAFTPAQLEKIEALARSIAKAEIAAFEAWVGQPAQRRGGCG